MKNNLWADRERQQDANLSDCLAVDHEISGLLTVTQKDLIEIVDRKLEI